MIITAEVDLSEAGARPDKSEFSTDVIVFESDEYDFAAGMEAIQKTRLIREGHVFEVKIHPAMGTVFNPFRHYMRIDANGEVIA